MEYGFLGMRFDLICGILEFEFTSYREKHRHTPPLQLLMTLFLLRLH